MGKFNLTDLLNGGAQTAPEGAAPADRENPRKLGYKIIPVSVYDLIPSEGNFYSLEEIEKLKRDIELAGGVKQNLTVTPLGDGKYKVLAGHRRRLASLALAEEGKREYEFLPCGIEPRQPDKELQEIREELLIITTNSQRDKTDWDRVQEVQHLHAVLQRYKAYGGKLPGRVREIIADTLNTSTTQVGRLEAIGKNLSPEFQQEMKEKRLGLSAAYELSGLPKEQQREAYAEYQRKGGISINDVRQRKEAEKPPQAAAPPPPAMRKDATPPPASPASIEAAPHAKAPRDCPPPTPDEAPAVLIAETPRPTPPSVQENQTDSAAEVAQIVKQLDDLCGYCMGMGEAENGDREWALDVNALLFAIQRLGGESE